MDELETITIDFDVYLDQVNGKYRIIDFSVENDYDNFTGKIFSPTKNLTLRNGFLHSFNDQPAYESSTSLYWLNDGIVHRKGGPPK